MEPLVPILTAFGGLLTGVIPTGIWAWQKIGSMRAESEKAKQHLIDETAKAKQELDAKQKEIDSKAERDKYDLAKTKKSDANAEIMAALDERKEENADLHERLEAQDQRISTMQAKYSAEITAMQTKYSGEIMALQAENLDCAKKSARQEVDSERNLRWIQILTEEVEMWKLRVRTLEGNAAPAPLPPPQTPGAAMATAVKEIATTAAKETIAEAATAAPQPKVNP